MCTAEVPFPMKATYLWKEAGLRKTFMILQIEGQPKGFSSFMAPLISIMMRKANQKDLIRLKLLLED